MRSTLPRQLARLAGSSTPRAALPPTARPVPQVALGIRPLSTSLPLYKKSKAAASKKAHKAAKEDAEVNPESHRYDPAPEDELDEVLSKTKKAMTKAVDWARSIAYEGVERGRGRVTPGMSSAAHHAL